jgi:predicted DNA-binding WGR domain protein
MSNLNRSIIERVAPVHLQRIDLGRNIARFYSMAVERDLFGHVVLVRRWGRLGTAGRTRLDEYRGEGEALAALQALQTTKRRKGYQAIGRLPRA